MDVDKLIYEYKKISEMVELEYIKEEQAVIILEGYDYFREVNTLFYRVHNLLDAIFELLLSNMAEEAYILFRSLINSQIIIAYLLNNFKNKQCLDEYLMQPTFGRIKYLKNIKGIYKQDWFVELNEKNNSKICIDDIDKEIAELTDSISRKGFKNAALTPVYQYAMDNNLSYGLYRSEYHEASKAEHGDPSFTKFYREQIMSEYNNDLVYKPNISKTNIELKEKLFKLSIHSYSYIFILIVGHITNNEEQLLLNYNKENLSELMIRIHWFDETYLNV